jgi:hypothetical protein
MRLLEDGAAALLDPTVTEFFEQPKQMTATTISETSFLIMAL